jgi:hypothetical protein
VLTALGSSQPGCSKACELVAISTPVLDAKINSMADNVAMAMLLNLSSIGRRLPSIGLEVALLSQGTMVPKQRHPFRPQVIEPSEGLAT